MRAADLSPTTARSDAAVDLAGITLVRGGTTILRDVTWRVDRNQHWAVLGANGAGKTMLLRVIAGWEWPTEGRATVLGETFGSVDLRDLRPRIGWVTSSLSEWIPPTATALDTVLTGRNSLLGLRGPSTPEDRERALELLTFLGCGGRGAQSFGTLSQGERQKVLIARALMPAPELLVLDEVCAGLDLAARESFLATVERLGRDPSGPTMILVTHHIEEIVSVFAQVLVLRRGEVVAQGAKETVFSDGALAEALGVPLDIENRDGRFWPRVLRERDPGATTV